MKLCPTARGHVNTESTHRVGAQTKKRAREREKKAGAEAIAFKATLKAAQKEGRECGRRHMCCPATNTRNHNTSARVHRTIPKSERTVQNSTCVFLYWLFLSSFFGRTVRKKRMPDIAACGAAEKQILFAAPSFHRSRCFATRQQS